MLGGKSKIYMCIYICITRALYRVLQVGKCEFTGRPLLAVASAFSRRHSPGVQVQGLRSGVNMVWGSLAYQGHSSRDESLLNPKP